MKLTSKNVWNIFKDCLFREEESRDNAVMARGVVATFGFHPDRLEKHKDEIYSMLKQLPSEFQKDAGGGWSFIKAPFDKDGNQWGEQKNAEQLLCLGMGIDKVQIRFSSEMMKRLNLIELLPGGVSYYMVL